MAPRDASRIPFRAAQGTYHRRDPRRRRAPFPGPRLPGGQGRRDRRRRRRRRRLGLQPLRQQGRSLRRAARTGARPVRDLHGRWCAARGPRARAAAGRCRSRGPLRPRATGPHEAVRSSTAAPPGRRCSPRWWRRVQRSLADHERRTAALIEAAVRSGDARPLDSRRAAATYGRPGRERSPWAPTPSEPHPATIASYAPCSRLGCASSSEAWLRIPPARGRPAPCARCFESAPAPSSGSPARHALRRAPRAGNLRAELPELALWTTQARSSVRTEPGLGPPPTEGARGAI